MDRLQNYVTKSIGRCLTETKHPMYDELIKECVGFYTTPIDAEDTSGYPMHFEPKCSAMQCCWGLMPDSDMVVKLWWIIDSSD